MGNVSAIIAGWHAKVAELVDALALGASGVTRESSSLSFRTKSELALKSTLSNYIRELEK